MSDIVRLILIILLVVLLIWLLLEFIMNWRKDKKIVNNRRSANVGASKPMAAAGAASMAAEKKTAPAARPRKTTPTPQPAANVKPDDLTKIEGIGPKIAELLNNDGIKTFAALAAANAPRISKVLHDAGSRFQMHDPTSWPEQAALAAKGDWKTLEALQDRLDGGR